MTRTVALEHSWQALSAISLISPIWALREFLLEKRAGKRLYPPGPQMFAAMDLVPVEQVKIVIIGQDPITGPIKPWG